MRAVVLAVLVLLTGVAAAAAQAPARLAVLSPIASSDGFIRWFLPELARAGFVEGRNLILDVRYGSQAEYTALARAIVADKPNVIMSISGGPLQALRGVTTSIPIVSAGGDPVEFGMADSMARPGGNVTGYTVAGVDLDAKRMELVSQVLGPGVAVAGLLQPDFPSVRQSETLMRQASQQGGFTPVFVMASGRGDYERAIRDARAAGARGLVLMANPAFYRDTALIMDLATKAGLATACEWREMAEQGCLVGYGPSRAAMYQWVARKVALILNGARPNEIPIERPTVFELVINQRTTRTLGIDLPATILGRAEEVLD